MKSRLVLVTLVFCLGLVGALVARADDVPDDARKWFDKGRAQFAAGDAKKAFSSLSKGKMKAGDSIDFWALYIKVYRANGKKEDILWDKIIAKAEAKHPSSPNFHLLRYRLAKEFDEKVKHLKAAIAKVPDDIGPKLLLAKEYVRNEDETQAEEILDAVLEKDPGNEVALVLKGDMMIGSGFSRSAIDHAEEHLETYDLPGLHDLAARAYIIVAENDESALAKAAEHAKKAVAGRPDPEYVLTYAQILDDTDKTAEAVKVLSDCYAKTASEAVAGRLGELAFRTGDYEKAVKGLGPAAADDLNTARALLESESRRGRAKQAQAALKHVLAQDAEEGWLWAVGLEVELGDYAAALKYTEGKEGEDADYCRLLCAGRLGKVADAAALANEKAKEGSRDAEEWLVHLATARLTAALADKAKGVWKSIVEARWAAGKAKVAGAEHKDVEAAGTANSFAFMQRSVTYRRALNNHWFNVGGFSPAQPIPLDDKMAVAPLVAGTSDCKRDEQRVFPFNPQFIESGNITIKIDDGAEIWKEADAGFKAGCAAFVAEDWAKADEEFGKAAEKEPTWGRAILFQAAAKALGGGAADAAALAKKAAELLPDDWHGRELGILIRSLGGDDAGDEIKAFTERYESYAARYYEDF